MERGEILAKVKAILSENFSIPENKITPKATFGGSLGMDSLDIVDFVFFLQQTFGLQDTLEAYKDLETVEQLLDYIGSKGDS